MTTAFRGMFMGHRKRRARRRTMKHNTGAGEKREEHMFRLWRLPYNGCWPFGVE
jgi:hypothetical protein